MNKLRSFARVFQSSLFEPGVYGRFLKRSFMFSSLYLLGLLTFLVFIKSVAVVIPFVIWSPHAKGAFTEYRLKALEWYPKGLTVTFNNGSVRTNMDEPYAIAFPKDFGINDKTFITFDTRAQTKSITEYQTYILVTKNSIVYPDTTSDKGYKIYPFKKSGDYFMITKENYEVLVNKLYSVASALPQFFILGILTFLFGIPFIMGGLWFVLMSVRIFFLTLIVLGLSKLLKKSFTLRQLFQLGLHAATFPLLFEFLNSSNNMGIPFAFSFPFVAWMVIVMISLPKNSYGPALEKSV